MFPTLPDRTSPLGHGAVGLSGLPLPTTPSARPRPGFTGRFAVSVINDRARIAARAVTDHLGWQPGQHLHYRLSKHVVTITPDHTRSSRHTLSNYGHLRLPAAIRHATGITAGDALLLAAFPEDDLAVLLPLQAQEIVLDTVRTFLQDPA